MAQINVNQVSEFGNYFKDFVRDYVVIGGAATLLYLNERSPDGHNKATKDLDIVVLDLNKDGSQSAFLKQFKTYIDEMKYQIAIGKTGEINAYRFINPENKLAPSKIEIATRAVDGLQIEASNPQRLTEFEMSAMVCDNLYIDHLQNNCEIKNISGAGGGPVPVANVATLILLKSLAYINLIDSAKDHADRHAADIIRLSSILISSDKINVSAKILEPYKKIVEKKEQVFSSERVRQIRGSKITSDKIIDDINKIFEIKK